MKKTFDQMFNELIGENLMQASTQQTAPTKPNQPQQQNQQQQQGQQDPEITKAFETLLKKAGTNQDHQKAIQALQQLLTQQQNAANKPA